MRWGPGISPSYYEHGPWLLSKENKRKIDPTETPSCLIPRLLVVFTQQLEILVTTLQLAKHIKIIQTDKRKTRMQKLPHLNWKVKQVKNSCPLK